MIKPQVQQAWKDELDKLEQMANYWFTLVNENPNNPSHGYSQEYVRARYHAATIAWHAVAVDAAKKEILTPQ